MPKTSFAEMKPRELEGYFRDLLLKTFGNDVEDAANVNSHSGAYYVSFTAEGVDYAFRFKKKSAAKIAKTIRGLKGK